MVCILVWYVFRKAGCQWMLTVSLFSIPNYQTFHQGKSRCSNHGGLLTYVHTYFTASVRKSCRTSSIWEGLFIDLIGEYLPKRITIGNLYRHPRDNNNKINIESFIGELTPIVHEIGEQCAYALILGNFNIDLLQINEIEKFSDFYQRPVLAFRYCRCLRSSVSPSVRPSVTKFFRAITHHPFKLGSPNLDHRCKRPWLRSLLFFGVIDLDLQFTPFWACPRDNSSPVQARVTKFGPEVLNTLVKIPVVLGVDWAWNVKFNLFSKSCLCASFLHLWNICETCKNGWNGVCSTS